MALRSAFSAFLLTTMLVACGDDESPGGSSPGGSSEGGSDTGGNGSGGDAPGLEPKMTAVHAPDEHTVVAQLEGTGVVAPEGVNMYEIESEFGNLPVTNVAYDAAANTITLATDKQKLGVNYYLTIKAPGNTLDLETGQFLSADTPRSGPPISGTTSPTTRSSRRALPSARRSSPTPRTRATRPTSRTRSTSSTTRSTRRRQPPSTTGATSTATGRW